MEKAEKYLVIITPGFPANEEDTTCLPSQQLLVRALNRIDPALDIVILSYGISVYTKGVSLAFQSRDTL